MATGAATSTSGVSQPAGGLQLKELNRRSATLGFWDVGISFPEIVQWTNEDKKTKKEKKGAAFKCLLVSLQDPSQYVKGEIWMTDKICNR